MKRFLLALSLVALATLDVVAPGPSLNGMSVGLAEYRGRSTFQVTRMAIIQRVTDGDTVVLRDGTRVRLIGVDTPEVFFGVECWGPQASAFTERHLEGDRVGLEFDLDRKDRFGRTLAYIHDSRFPGRTFQWVLVRRGFGLAKYYAPNGKYRALLEEAQRKASLENRGLWGACGG